MKLPSGCFLGIDFGTSKIGLAAGDNESRQVREIGIIKTQHENWETILDRHVAKWQPLAFVIGKPIMMKPEDASPESSILEALEDFGRFLQERYNRPIFWEDESNTTWQAKQEMRARGVSGTDLHNDDSVAAGIILKQWLDKEQ